MVSWNSSEKGINITIEGRWVGRASDEEGISEKLSFFIIIILIFFRRLDFSWASDTVWDHEGV